MTQHHILINDLEVNVLIGAHDHERLAKQVIKISLDITSDFSAAIESDKVADTNDYDGLVRLVTTIADTTSYVLLESLASHIRNEILALPKVSAVSVSIEKPNISPHAKSIIVKIAD